MRQITMLQDQAYEIMIEKIKNQELEAGEIYSLNQIAKSMGISKTPLRDAVMMLAKERYVDIIPSRGFMLHTMSENDIIETYQFRHAIEIYCLRRLAENINTERGQEYYEKIKRKAQEQALLIQEGKSEESIVRKDYEFHRSMVQYLDNSEMLEIYRNYMYRMFHFNVHALHSRGRREGTIEEHEDILKAVRQQDYEHLEQIVAFHLDIAREINLNRL